MNTEPVYGVILNWNGKEDTLACLASVLAMDPKPSQVILVDNASTDGTPQAVAERFPAVQVLVNEENLGFAGGMNVGLRAALDAQAAYVLVLNNDTLVAPDMLGVLVETIEADGRIGIVAPKIYYADPQDRADRADRADIPHRIWYAGAMRRRWWPGFSFPGYGKRDAAAYDHGRDVDYATGCGFLVRGQVLQQVGLFDETSYFMYHEDLDLSERVRRAGYRIVYVPQGRMWHRESASTDPMSPQKWYYLARYIVPFYQEYSRWPGPALVAYALYVTGREILKGHPQVIPAFLRGIRDGMREQGSSSLDSSRQSMTTLEKT